MYLTACALFFYAMDSFNLFTGCILPPKPICVWNVIMICPTRFHLPLHNQKFIETIHSNAREGYDIERACQHGSVNRIQACRVLTSSTSAIGLLSKVPLQSFLIQF
jgi:hypothetical protein